MADRAETQPIASSAGVSAHDSPPRQLGLLASAESPRQIGVVSPCYGAEKVSYSLPLTRYAYRHLYRLPFHRLERDGTFWRETPVVWDRSVKLLHTFNEIPIGTRPFVVSFENEFPRYLGEVAAWQFRTGLRLLRSDRCRRLLSLSETAARVARDKFQAAGEPEIAAKVGVFKGGLKLPPSMSAPRPDLAGRPLRLLFVGADAIRKGLVPAVAAVEAGRREGLDVELTVISTLRRGETYTHKEHTPSADALERRLAELPFVQHHKGLPNDQVREAMRSHDALVFPTFDESLGWVVAEAGLEGLPTLATNIFAIPELIEDRETGALVEVEIGAQSRWQGLWELGSAKADAIEAANASIEKGLVRIFEEVVAEPELLTTWGQAARDRMLRIYEPEGAARSLEAIYDEIEPG